MGIPRHVAIIMDGNGRWAKARGMPRYRGHQVGAESARAIIRRAGEIGIEVLTLFTLSEDNLLRSREELDFIMALLNRYLVKERAELRRNNVHLRTIGDLTGLPSRTQRLIEETRLFLQDNDGLTLNIALNYLWSQRDRPLPAARLPSASNVANCGAARSRRNCLTTVYKLRACLILIF